MLRLDYYRGHKVPDMLMQARALDDAELNKHALVSRKNYHRCPNCFTCAAAQVQREREVAAKR